MARNKPFHDRRNPWTTMAITGPADKRQERRCSDDPGPERTLKEVLLVAQNQVNQGKNTAGATPRTGLDDQKPICTRVNPNRVGICRMNVDGQIAANSSREMFCPVTNSKMANGNRNTTILNSN